MGRLLQLILLVALAVLVWRVVRKALAPPAAPPPTPFQPMARCAGCGTHVPAAELDSSGQCPRCRTGR
ncbi:MAG TPA: hypothetical protein VM240_05605 [Verrucomicrobiae bacterium]|nr:hypothetical protein [Verrucomicrobiae bacterium]